MRAWSLGERVVAADQVGGHCRYLVTRERYDIGAHTHGNSVPSRDAEPVRGQATPEVVREAAYVAKTRGVHQAPMGRWAAAVIDLSLDRP